MRNQNGNALWFILIAVALLGFLTAILTRSSSTVDQTGNLEQTRISASKILKYARSIQSAVEQLQMRGCSENEINFDNTVVSGYTNANAPSNGNCDIFTTSGAGLTYQTPQVKWLDTTQSGETGYKQWLFTANNYVVGVETGTDSLGDSTGSNKELLIALPYININLCTALNDLVGVSNPSGAPPQDNNTADLTPKFTGTFGSGHHIQDTTSGTDALNEKRTGCFEGGGTPATGTYHFYHTLIAR